MPFSSGGFSGGVWKGQHLSCWEALLAGQGLQSVIAWQLFPKARQREDSLPSQGNFLLSTCPIWRKSLGLRTDLISKLCLNQAPGGPLAWPLAQVPARSSLAGHMVTRTCARSLCTHSRPNPVPCFCSLRSPGPRHQMSHGGNRATLSLGMAVVGRPGTKLVSGR